MSLAQKKKGEGNKKLCFKAHICMKKYLYYIYTYMHTHKLIL